MSEGIKELEKQLTNGWVDGKPYVFISYASRDKEYVYPLVLELRKRGFNIYIDAEFKENATRNWLEQAKAKLFDADCKGIITLLSVNYMRSYACFIEQLINRSEDMKEDRGASLPVIYISLDKKMGSKQSITEYITSDDIRKASKQESVTMETEECKVLEETFLNCNFESYDTKDKVAAEIAKIKDKHNVATKMNKFIFGNGSINIQLFESVKETADLLENNFTNSKNEDINLEKIPELTETQKPNQVKTDEDGTKDNDLKKEESLADSNIFYFKGATAVSDRSGGMIVKKGSKIAKKEVSSCPEGARKSREEALQKGELIDTGTEYELVIDKGFKSASGAACFVSGSSVNGKIEWKNKKPNDFSSNQTVSKTGISSKMNQILMVLKKVFAMQRPIADYSLAISKAASEVSEELHITKSSVVDKCQRQLGLSAIEFRSLVMQYVLYNDTALKDLLMQHATSEEEKEAILSTFS